MLKYQILKTVLFFIFFEHFKAMNTEATRDFCLTCDNEIVEKILKKQNLNFTVHEQIPKDSRESFLKTFSILLNLSEEQLLTTLRNRRRELNFITLQKVEYGENMIRHVRDQRKISNLAWISCLAEEYKREIIVVCDLYSLNFAHNGKTVLIFKPSQLIQNVDPIGCLLFGFNSYHPIINSESLQRLATNLSFNRIFYRSREIMNEEDDSNAHFYGEERDIDISFVEAIGREEILVAELGIPAENPVLSNDRLPQEQGPTNSIRLEEFLNIHYERSLLNNLNVESLTSNVKINMCDSALNRHELSMKKTHDIDGLFGIFDPSDYGKVVKCPVKVLVFPALVDPRTSKNIAKLYPANVSRHYQNIKIGVIELPFGTIDLIVIIESTSNIIEKNVKTAALTSASFARSLPCANDTEHFQSCRSLAVRNSHRGNMPASIASRNKKEYENYSPLIAGCYLHHFVSSMNKCLNLSRRNISMKIFFKCVGSKSFTFSENSISCLDALRQFEAAIDFSQIDNSKVWVDYCITTSAESLTGPVIHTY